MKAGRGALLAIAAHPKRTRWLLAGPGVAVTALLLTAALPVWLPSGAAGVNHIAYPLVLAPLVWVVLFLYACLEERVVRCAAVVAGLATGGGAVVAAALLGWV